MSACSPSSRLSRRSHRPPSPRAPSCPSGIARCSNDYCLKCHNAETQEGKFRVDDLPLVIADLETAERWQKVLNALNSGEMPPADEKQPPSAREGRFSRRPGERDGRGPQDARRSARRRSRCGGSIVANTQGTLRELLGVEINVSELPADVGTGGFDTVGSNLFMSSNQFEQYLALGREALDEAFERQAAAGVEEELATSKGKRRSYGSKSSTPTISTPASGRSSGSRRSKPRRPGRRMPPIVAEIRKTAKDDAIFRRSWEKIPGAPVAGRVRLSNGREQRRQGEPRRGLRERRIPARITSTICGNRRSTRGAYLTIGIGNDLNSHLPMLVPFGWPVGDYVVRIRAAAANDQCRRERRFLEFGIHPRHGQVLSTHEITGTMDAPQIDRDSADADPQAWRARQSHAVHSRERNGRSLHADPRRLRRSEAAKRHRPGGRDLDRLDRDRTRADGGQAAAAGPRGARAFRSTTRLRRPTQREHCARRSNDSRRGVSRPHAAGELSRSAARRSTTRVARRATSTRRP